MAGVNQVFSLADDVARYVKACGKRSILECKPNKIDFGSVFSHTHKTSHWEMFSEAPTQAYATKPAVYIEKIMANGNGAGTREIKKLVRESLADPETEGRILLSAEMLDAKKGHPVGFYYKLGFRSCDEGVNRACEKWLSNGGDINLAPGKMCNGKIIPLGTKRGFRTIMYLPEENIQHCLNYPDIKGIRMYCPTNILEKNGTITLLDDAGKSLSTAFLLKESNSQILILDISSDIKGKGYGTKLLDEIKSRYPDAEIHLAACWEQFISKKPPHKFYLNNGFVAKDKNIHEKLLTWLNKGAKASDFPLECDCCEMVYKNRLQVNA